MSATTPRKFKQRFATATAPGRLDVMGGIADYSGSLVLQLPLRESTQVTIHLRDDFQCYLKSHSENSVLTAEFDFRKLLLNGKTDPDRARSVLSQSTDSWCAYVLGCIVYLVYTEAIEFTGADIEIHSNVPIGKGVSSSAALEVATLKALAIIYDIPFTGTELPRMAQAVENRIVGAPCGLMDQLTSYFGQTGKLLPIICQPDQVLEPLPIPPGITFMGLDSGVRHAVGGSSYSSVRCAAFMGYSIIAQSLGATAKQIQQARSTGDTSGLPYRGYLCNIPVEEFELKFDKLLPDHISGQEFQQQFGSTIDSATAIDENVVYSIKNCTQHPVYENQRVRLFKDHLMNFTNDSISVLGKLMYDAHESYSRCGLGSAQTDEIVEASKAYSGIAGAKITGGGSGGTVCVLVVGYEGKEGVREVQRRFSASYNKNLVLLGSE